MTTIQRESRLMQAAWRTKEIAYFIKSLSARGLPYWMQSGRGGHFAWPSRKCIPQQKWVHLIVMLGAKLRSTCCLLQNTFLYRQCRKCTNFSHKSMSEYYGNAFQSKAHLPLADRKSNTCNGIDAILNGAHEPDYVCIHMLMCTYNKYMCMLICN